MKRGIVYIIIGIGGLYCVPFIMKSLFIDTIPFPLYLLVGFSGLIFYGVVLWIGLERLVKSWALGDKG